MVAKGGGRESGRESSKGEGRVVEREEGETQCYGHEGVTSRLVQREGKKECYDKRKEEDICYLLGATIHLPSSLHHCPTGWPCRSQLAPWTPRTSPVQY